MISLISVLIGTKGQFIKMIPILIELEKRGHTYNFINARQHAESLDKMIKLFKIKEANEVMWNYGKDITSIKEILSWLIINAAKFSIGKKRLIFRNKKKKNILLVHGDAPPVLLGLFLGKFHNMNIAHIEAGCRSDNLFSPFPEEIIRIIADRFSNLLFPLSEFSCANVLGKYKSKLVFPMERNTVYDTVRIALENPQKLIEKKYVLASIHRFETILSQRRMRFIVDLFTKNIRNEKIILPLHESTKNAMIKFNLYNELANNSNVIITPLMDYFTYISHIRNAKYLITDGGGPQEESYYLGTPSLLLREKTERIWKNNCLAGFDIERINHFLTDPEKYRSKPLRDNYSSSKLIVDILEKLGYTD